MTKRAAPIAKAICNDFLLQNGIDPYNRKEVATHAKQFHDYSYFIGPDLYYCISRPEHAYFITDYIICVKSLLSKITGVYPKQFNSHNRKRLVYAHKSPHYDFYPSRCRLYIQMATEIVNTCAEFGVEFRSAYPPHQIEEQPDFDFRWGDPGYWKKLQ